MGNVKKCILVLTVILALFVVCSLSAFAYEPGDTFDFQLSSFPVNSLTNNATNQAWSYFIQNSNYEVLYVEMWTYSANGRFNSEIALTMGSFFESNLNRFRFLPCLVNYGLNGPGYSYYYDIYIRVYDVTGALVDSHGLSRGVSGNIPSFSWIDNWNGNGSDYSRFSVMSDVDAWFPIVSPSKFLVANETIQNNLPSGYPDVLWGYYDTDQPSNMGECSIDATILVNGEEIYSSGGDTPSASVISGSSSGTITDSNGNTYNTYNEYNFELPEYDGEIGVGEYPTMPQFDDSALSVMDGGLALQWIYDKLQYFYTNQQKIALLLTSCLSLGVVMLILNKRS